MQLHSASMTVRNNQNPGLLVFFDRLFFLYVDTSQPRPAKPSGGEPRVISPSARVDKVQYLSVDHISPKILPAGRFHRHLHPSERNVCHAGLPSAPTAGEKTPAGSALSRSKKKNNPELSWTRHEVTRGRGRGSGAETEPIVMVTSVCFETSCKTKRECDGNVSSRVTGKDSSAC